MALRTTRITVRGTVYTIRELSGKQMLAVRKLLDPSPEKGRLEAYVAFAGTADPAFNTEEEAMEAPFAVLAKLSNAIFKLGAEEDEEGSRPKVQMVPKS